MGNRRIGRKRLYAVEKAGKKIDLESGPGIKDAIASASQHRNGQEIITEIAIDLGSSKLATPVKSGNNNRDVIGVPSGGAAYITRLTKAKFGIITEVRAVCVETPDSIANLDLEFGDDGDGVQDAQDSDTPTSILTDLTAAGVDKSTSYSNNALLDQYLYICNGANDTPEDFGAGKILIYIHGFEEPADL